ncbi:MAG: Crp/Fnr family transcriptional regulator [Aureispira sp.]|nr:Crp/Fnr family transcriptional regulator [Aureispira sp.]
MSLEPFRNWVKQVPFLEEEDCLLFESALKVRSYAKKDWVIQAGQVCRELGFINKGAFRLFYITDEGKEINTHFFFENEFLADYRSFLDQAPSHYYIAAIEPAEVVFFDYSTLQNAYQQSPRWSQFGRLMAEQAYKISMDRTASFLFYEGKERYLELEKNAAHILQRVPLYHIASYLGLERESLSRLRKKIAENK